jgi:hypothetical protein
LKLLNLKESAYQQYRLTVKGNETISFDQAMLKLNRNVLLAVERKSIKNTLKCKRVYIYGCMRIITRFGTIIDIENHINDPIPNWKKDEKKYDQISKQLGIYQNKFKKRKYIY